MGSAFNSQTLVDSGNLPLVDFYCALMATGTVANDVIDMIVLLMSTRWRLISYEEPAKETTKRLKVSSFFMRHQMGKYHLNGRPTTSMLLQLTGSICYT